MAPMSDRRHGHERDAAAGAHGRGSRAIARRRRGPSPRRGPARRPRRARAPRSAPAGRSCRRSLIVDSSSRQVRLERVQPAAQAGVDGPARQVQRAGDLAGGVLEHVAQHDDRAMLRESAWPAPPSPPRSSGRLGASAGATGSGGSWSDSRGGRPGPGSSRSPGWRRSRPATGQTAAGGRSGPAGGSPGRRPPGRCPRRRRGHGRSGTRSGRPAARSGGTAARGPPRSRRAAPRMSACSLRARARPTRDWRPGATTLSTGPASASEAGDMGCAHRPWYGVAFGKRSVDTSVAFRWAVELAPGLGEAAQASAP